MQFHYAENTSFRLLKTRKFAGLMLAPRVVEHVRVPAPEVFVASSASRRRRWRGSRRLPSVILSGLNLPALPIGLDADGAIKVSPVDLRA